MATTPDPAPHTPPATPGSPAQPMPMAPPITTPPVQAPSTQINTTREQQPGDASAHSKLPHERDQSVNMTDGEPSPDMQQAHADLQRGLVDTDARGADGKPLGSKQPTG